MTKQMPKGTRRSKEDSFLAKIEIQQKNLIYLREAYKTKKCELQWIKDRLKKGYDSNEPCEIANPNSLNQIKDESEILEPADKIMDYIKSTESRQSMNVMVATGLTDSNQQNQDKDKIEFEEAHKQLTQPTSLVIPPLILICPTCTKIYKTELHFKNHRNKNACKQPKEKDHACSKCS